MRIPDAYQQQQVNSLPRIDLILALYRKALEKIQQARQALAEERNTAARAHLGKAQLIVSALASGLAGNTEEMAVNFLRLYEFATDRLARGGMDDLDAAHQVLQTLLEGFEAARAQAVTLEADGTL